MLCSVALDIAFFKLSNTSRIVCRYFYRLFLVDYSACFLYVLSFKDIQRNGYHIDSMIKDGIGFLCIKSERKHILEELRMLSSELYCTKITMTESYAVVNMKFTDTFKIWHERTSWFSHDEKDSAKFEWLSVEKRK